MIARAARVALLARRLRDAPPQTASRASRRPAAFEMSGRLAVRQGDRSEIAKLRWTHRPRRDLWVIASPLGNEVARLESRARGATLTRAGSASESAASFQALTEKLLVLLLDPNEIASWLHGGVPGNAPGDWKVSVDEPSAPARSTSPAASPPPAATSW
jgi:outer membrane biogenesis lipoprotein LolB